MSTENFLIRFLDITSKRKDFHSWQWCVENSNTVRIFFKCDNLYKNTEYNLVEVTPENINLLEKCYEECKASPDSSDEFMGPYLFSLRVQKGALNPIFCLYLDKFLQKLFLEASL